MIIVAGGIGKRMQSKIPKQFLKVNNKSLILYSIEAFLNHPGIDEVILVLNKEFHNLWDQIYNEQKISYPLTLVTGGPSRFDSVKNGLTQVHSAGLVAIHDGVRPFPSQDLIERCFREAAQFGTAIPAIPVNDTLRKIEGKSSSPINRHPYRMIQTPQCFISSIIIEAYQVQAQDIFTDDSSVVEKAGHTIHLIEGEPNNIKITTPVDLRLAEVMAKKQLAKS